MKHLLDVNLLLAAIWSHHPLDAKAFAWPKGQSVVVCAITELGFLRISTKRKALNAWMATVRQLLATFVRERKATRIADDLPALDSKPATSEPVTDHYLAALAEEHGLKLATFDTGAKHRAVDLVSLGSRLPT